MPSENFHWIWNISEPFKIGLIAQKVEKGVAKNVKHSFSLKKIPKSFYPIKIPRKTKSVAKQTTQIINNSQFIWSIKKYCYFLSLCFLINAEYNINFSIFSAVFFLSFNYTCIWEAVKTNNLTEKKFSESLKLSFFRYIDLFVIRDVEPFFGWKLKLFKARGNWKFYEIFFDDRGTLIEGKFWCFSNFPWFFTEFFAKSYRKSGFES